MARYRVECIRDGSQVRLARGLPPVGKIVCLGLAYRDHALEQGHEPPKTPLLFAKFPSALGKTGDPIVKPRESEKVDYEAELAVVIGKEARRIPPERAMECVLGYMNLNDVSARDIQFAEKQWTRGKSFDTFAPCGPEIVTPDEAGDPHDFAVRCWVNGELRQDGSTSDLLFRIPEIISYVSRSATLYPGDVISTGTPCGVGVFRKPPVFLKAGDLVEIEVGPLGRLSNRVQDGD